MRCLLLIVWGLIVPGFLLAGPAVRINLESNWEFSQIGKNAWLPAEVPGTVHTDLLANGEIPDPFYGTNEKGLQWIGRMDWEYRTEFDVSADLLQNEHLALRFNGLDTYAEVFLNGKPLLTADNMFRTWEIECKSQLRTGKNQLRIVFRSPFERVSAQLEALPYQLPSPNDAGKEKISVFVRKAGYHFGWDWGPRFVTMGIWRPINLLAWNEARITDVYTRTDGLETNEARLRARVEVNAPEAGDAKLALVLNGDTIGRQNVVLNRGRNVLEEAISIANPRLWWPAGMGKPYLYNLKAVLLRADNSIIDQRKTRVGLRRIELIQQTDSIGESFFFRVNGTPIFVKGTNYIPPDNFIPRGRSKREKLFRAIKGANMNMVRVWGGGIYEDDTFYDLCDENGIMVWQDFMFACAMYPGDTAFLNNVRGELQDNIRRLRHHPSLAMWCGNNEIEVAWHNWGWQQEYRLDPGDSTRIWQDYLALFEDLIPRELAELDPGRPYIPSSPISNWGKSENFDRGDMHNWAVWHGEKPFSAFKADTPRFMSEFGFQSFPEIRTLAPVTSGGAPNREDLEDRQKSYKGTRLIDTHMNRWYSEYKDYESYLVLSQLLQAEGMKIAIENMRIEQPRCMGSLYWQLNDCWPGPSWSSVDYQGRWKALHYWMQHLYGPILLVAERSDNGELRVRAASDEPRARFGTIAMRLKSFDGDILWTQEQAVEIAPGAVKEYVRVPASIFPNRFDPNETVLEVILHARGKVLASNLLYFTQPKDMDLPDPEFSYRCSVAEGGGYLVEVRAIHQLKNVEFALVGIEAEFSDNYFDLAPGGIRQIMVSAPSIKDEKELVKLLRVRQMTDWVNED